jgi:hypothetical protein
MTMRDKIAAIICDGKLQMITYEGIADAIIKALPDYEAQQKRIKELEAAYGEACDRIAELGAALRGCEALKLINIEDFRVGPNGQTVAERAIKAMKGETK